MSDPASPNVHAKALFAPLGSTYDRNANLLSFGQDPRWRRFLVSRVDVSADSTVLDGATGTAAVAIELAKRTGARVVGIDQSPEMLAVARERVARGGLNDRIELIEGNAEHLPFPDGSFDALTFTYLLRYVGDPAATMSELARTVKPGGTIASLEFAIPPRPLPHLAWELYTRIGLPVAGRTGSATTPLSVSDLLTISRVYDMHPALMRLMVVAGTLPVVAGVAIWKLAG